LSSSGSATKERSSIVAIDITPHESEIVSVNSASCRDSTDALVRYAVWTLAANDHEAAFYCVEHLALALVDAERESRGWREVASVAQQLHYEVRCDCNRLRDSLRARLGDRR
jgi:hypothetical protein